MALERTRRERRCEAFDVETFSTGGGEDGGEEAGGVVACEEGGVGEGGVVARALPFLALDAANTAGSLSTSSAYTVCIRTSPFFM
jgi:hypothetical protein